MKRKHLKLTKESLRILTESQTSRAGGGGSLNCTFPTSVPQEFGCAQRDSGAAVCAG